MFKTTAIDTLKQDKKCQACWYIILSTMSGSTTPNDMVPKGTDIMHSSTKYFIGFCTIAFFATRWSMSFSLTRILLVFNNIRKISINILKIPLSSTPTLSPSVTSACPGLKSPFKGNKFQTVIRSRCFVM